MKLLPPQRILCLDVREVKPSGPTVEVGLPDTTSRTKPPHLRAARGMVGLVVNQRGEGNARSS
jgi:hypothetical protein